jgi:hypothetical protein
MTPQGSGISITSRMSFVVLLGLSSPLKVHDVIRGRMTHYGAVLEVTHAALSCARALSQSNELEVTVEMEMEMEPTLIGFEVQQRRCQSPLDEIVSLSEDGDELVPLEIVLISFLLDDFPSDNLTRDWVSSLIWVRPSVVGGCSLFDQLQG